MREVEYGGYLYSFDQTGLSVTYPSRSRANPIAFASAGAAIASAKPQDFPWKAIQKWFTSNFGAQLMPQAIASAVAGEVLDRLLGPDEWQLGINAKLEEINRKLDVILAEVRALRDFIREDNISFARSTLETRVLVLSQTITRYFLVAQTNRTLNPNENTLFLLHVAALEQALAELAALKDPQTQRPQSMLLFPQIQVGLYLLLAAQRIAGVRTEAKTLADFEKVFSTWAPELHTALKARHEQNDGMAKFFDDFPKRAWVGTFGRNGEGTFPNPVLNGNADLINVWAILRGDITSDFMVDFEIRPASQGYAPEEGFGLCQFAAPFTNQWAFANWMALGIANPMAIGDSSGVRTLDTVYAQNLYGAVDVWIKRELEAFNARRRELFARLQDTAALQQFSEDMDEGIAGFAELGRAFRTL